MWRRGRCLYLGSPEVTICSIDEWEVSVLIEMLYEWLDGMKGITVPSCTMYRQSAVLIELSSLR